MQHALAKARRTALAVRDTLQMVLRVAAFGSTADCGCEPVWFHNADCPFPLHCGRIVQNLFTRCAGRSVGRATAMRNAPTDSGACLHWKREPQWSRQQRMITESSVLFQGCVGLCTGRTLDCQSKFKERCALSQSPLRNGAAVLPFVASQPEAYAPERVASAESLWSLRLCRPPTET